MTDELHDGQVEVVDGGDAPVETEVQTPDGEGSDLAPEGEEKPSKIEFTEEQQRVFNDAIGKKTAKLREAERKAEEAERRAKELESKLPQETRPEVPPPPDPYDDDYEAKIRERDEAVARQVAFDARKEERERIAQEQAYKTQQEALAEHNKKVQAYSDRADTLGVSKDELMAAGQVVGDSGLNDALVNYILADEHGPLITKYLASNPMELDNISSMDVGSAAVHVATAIKPRLEALKPKPSSAPDPAPELNGMGAPPTQHPALEGATFE